MKKRRNMSLNNDVSQKQKLTEQFRTIWIPRQRTKEAACQLNNPIQVKKLSTDISPRESQSVVLGGNSLEFGMIKNKKHILESWEYQNSQPRIQSVDFSVQSASTTVQAFDWHFDGLYQDFDYEKTRNWPRRWIKSNSTFLDISDHQDFDARIKLYKLLFQSSSIKNNDAIETLTRRSNFCLWRNMSKNKTPVKNKNGEQCQPIWFPRQRNKDSFSIKHAPSSKKTFDWQLAEGR